MILLPISAVGQIYNQFPQLFPPQPVFLPSATEIHQAMDMGDLIFSFLGEVVFYLLSVPGAILRWLFLGSVGKKKTLNLFIGDEDMQVINSLLGLLLFAVVVYLIYKRL